MSDTNAETVCPPSDVPPLKVTLMRRVKFWRYEGPERLRSLWRRHWWPSRIRQLDRERADWQRWCQQAREEIAWLRAAQSDGTYADAGYDDVAQSDGDPPRIWNTPKEHETLSEQLGPPAHNDGEA